MLFQEEIRRSQLKSEPRLSEAEEAQDVQLEAADQGLHNVRKDGLPLVRLESIWKTIDTAVIHSRRFKS